MMNIYTVAFGESYRRQASLLVASLRLSGFAGGVIVLADGPIYAEGADVRRIPAGEWSRLGVDEDESRYARARLPLFCDAAKLPAGPLLYLDSDCLAFRDPAELFDVDGPATQFYAGRNFTNQCPNLRASELDFGTMLKQPAPCSGAVLFPADPIERRVFLELWDFENRSGVMDDNTALAAVLWRRYGLKELPGVRMKYEAKPPAESILTHYLNPFADQMEVDFVEHFGASALPTFPSRGVGDTIARLTTALGIKPCEGCKERIGKLNRWFPYSSAR